MLAGWAGPAPASLSCTRALGAPVGASAPLDILGVRPAAATFAVIPGRTYLVEVAERDADALMTVLDADGRVISRADNPERRAGTRRAVASAQTSSLVVRVTGKDAARAAGTAAVRVFDVARLAIRADCLAAFKAFAEADSDYASAEAMSTGHSASPAVGAHDRFLRAQQEYAAAEQALTSVGDRELQAEAVLAQAGVAYLDLEDWARAAESAVAAARLFGAVAPYRKALAEALLAAAWIEIGSAGSAALPVGGSGASANPLVRARDLLERLRRFHELRGETYDAALQVTNIALIYLYEGRYRECIAASTTSSQMFGAIHETLLRAQASQNSALCLWGLGRLPEALRGFERSLKDIGPDPYPTIYVASITNTALAEYALGHFDESLRLYDRAFAFTERIQSRRNEAYCLYGIGVNYYALGDSDRAREFLERSLEIRTVALDARGRLATLRALANVDAAQGRVAEALAADREALKLAVAPSTVARIEIQLAAHTAAAGRPAEGKAQLDVVISRNLTGDPAIHAEALLQRATLLRQLDRPHEALADLSTARPRLRAFGSVMDEFDADLELARALRMTGDADAALRAVTQALALSDAVRLQTANPELRAQLQAPLRPAYDLKLDLIRESYEHLVTEGRTGEAGTLAAAAFVTADASRAHSLADVALQTYPPAVRQALAPEFRRREALYRELAARRFALDTRLDRSGSADPRSKHLVADIAELEREVDIVNTRIASRPTRAHPSTAAAHARIGAGQPHLPTLPADTALVSYWLGSESAYAWVVFRQELHWLRLSSPADIAAQAAAFHRSLTRLIDVPPERRLQDSRALSERVVRPLEPWLDDKRRWLIVPDGALDYVPFAALQTAETGGSFVVTRHDIALASAAWALDASGTRGRSRARRGLLLVADPVYEADDPRILAVRRQPATARPSTGIRPDTVRRKYRRLRFTGQEAAGIAAQFVPADVDRLVGLDATRERLLSLDWSAYRFIHIATHGVVDAQVPQLSALILGSYDALGEVADDAIRVADLSLRTLPADVVVLSGCETALGRAVSSEGLVGLSSTMLARGARAVVASLWPVGDEIGAHLMTEFYRQLLPHPLAPETALGAAMRSVVSRDRSADPALWAAYQVSVAELEPAQPDGGTASR
ncbi:MAG: CHAT domain-containing protein [Gammaproteobacteria bacterium]|nr:CHAT domain-containing protein [Gammaproteobacteria bacterium]